MADLHAVLDGTVPEVQAFLDDASPAEREALLALEAQATVPRKGVLEYEPLPPLPEGATLVSDEEAAALKGWRALVDEAGDLVRRDGRLVRLP